EKQSAYTVSCVKSQRGLIIPGSILAAAIVLVAIVPIYFIAVKPKSSSSNNSSVPPSSPTSTLTSSGQPASAVVITGGDGGAVTTENGTTFTYSNPFGGAWYWDPQDPFNNNAQAQSWTLPLNQAFRFGADKIFGVNLGGSLTTEPVSWYPFDSHAFAPALYQKYPQAIDGWTLSQAMAADALSGGGLSQLETYYKMLITDQDFAEITGAGLNFLCIPLPYWVIEVRSGEPSLPKTLWTYLLKAIQCARKYGLRINLNF
ncbi:glycoside hydrolase superfamily, partial [Suillus placidus]